MVCLRFFFNMQKMRPMILNITEAGAGAPLVLLHGLFGAARNLGVLTRALSSSYRVMALDLRNHGDSPHDPQMDYAVMAQDVAETLASMDLPKFRLCGHSMGGKTAMMLALSRPDMVDHLAVMDIAPVSYQHDYTDLAEAMLAIPLSASLTRAEAEQSLASVVKEAPLRAFLLNNLVLGAQPHWRVGLKEIHANMANLFRWDDPSGTASYDGPALFLRGGASDYVTAAAEPAIRQRFPQAKIESIANASHWLHAEKPDIVITALQEFFAS